MAGERHSVASALNLAPRPTTGVEATAAALRHAIASGLLKPGERIKEIPVAAALGLSRGPVREALRVLAEEGLVRLVAKQGATVSGVHARDFMELYGLRLALGRPALRALVHGEPDLEAPWAELERLADATRGRRADEAVEADLAFQDALVRASGLERTAVIFARTTLQLRVYVGVVAIDYHPVLRKIHAEDEALIEAVAAGDADRALTVWQEKLHGWTRDFIQHLDETFDADAWLAVYGATAHSSGVTGRA